MVTDGYWIYCGDQGRRYINVEQLCCTPEIHITLYVNYTLTKMKGNESSRRCKVDREKGLLQVHLYIFLLLTGILFKVELLRNCATLCKFS